MFRLFIYPFFLLVFVSCVKLVGDGFPDFEKVPVVNSIIMKDSLVKVHLSFTAPIDSTKIEYITNATVDLYVDGEFIEQIPYVDTGMYVSSYTAKADAEYRCEIVVQGYGDISCSTVMPPISKITNVEFINEAGLSEIGAIYPAVKVTFDTNPDEVCYYEMVFTYKDKGYSFDMFPNMPDTLFYDIDVNEITDPILISEGLGLVVFSNELIGESSYEMQVNLWREDRGGSEMNMVPFVVGLRSVSYDYYKYVKQRELYEITKGDVFFENPQPIQTYSNIDGGYGIFASYACFESDTIYTYIDKQY